MVLDYEVFEYIDENSVFEEGFLKSLQNLKPILFLTQGYFQPMDTYRENLALNNIWTRACTMENLGIKHCQFQKNILVTGATGLLGSHFSNYLLENDCNFTALAIEILTFQLMKILFLKLE